MGPRIPDARISIPAAADRGPAAVYAQVGLGFRVTVAGSSLRSHMTAKLSLIKSRKAPLLTLQCPTDLVGPYKGFEFRACRAWV